MAYRDCNRQTCEKSGLVQSFHQQGLIYANSEQNVVFAMPNAKGDVTRAFMRGTGGEEDNSFMGYAAGTKRNTRFYFQQGGQNNLVQQVAIALLQNAITPKSKGGSYAANNATGIKRLVEQALALLQDER